MNFEEALATVQAAREKDEAVRDVLLEIRQDLDLDEDYEFLRALFEASFPDTVALLNQAGRQSIFSTALDDGPLLSAYNEYCNYMELAQMIQDSVNTNFARPSNSFATEVAESANPIGALFAVLRKKKNLTELQFATILEAAFPLATNGLDEDTRNHIFKLANERGINEIEIANVYTQFADLVVAIRFLEDDDTE